MPGTLRAGLLLLVMFVLSSPVPAGSSSVFLESISVDIDLKEDSSMVVTERLEYVFTGDWTGGKREIPIGTADNVSSFALRGDRTHYIPGDVNEKYRFEVVTEADRKLVRWRSRRDSDPPYANTKEVFFLRYVVDGGIHHHVDRDTLRWKVISGEREWVVRRASATLRLPSKIEPGSVRAGLITGARNPGWRFLNRKTVLFTAEELQPGDLFEIEVDLPKGVVVEKFSYRKLMNRPVPSAFLLLFPSAVFVLMLYLYFKFGRENDPRIKGRMIKTQPSDLPPAMAGTLVDEKAGPNAVMATLIDLARRGFLSIAETEIGTGDRFQILTLLKDSPNVLPYERMLIEGIFKKPLKVGDKVSTMDLKGKFFVIAGDIESAVYEECIRFGYFAEDPRAFRRKYLVIGAVVIALGLLPLFFTDPFSLTFLSSIAYGFILSGAIVSLFALAMPKRTLLGSSEQARWKAFKNFLNDTREQNSDIENHLAYAVAFGAVKPYLTKYLGTEIRPVIWYNTGQEPASGRGTDAEIFSSHFYSMLSNISDAMARPMDPGGTR